MVQYCPVCMYPLSVDHSQGCANCGFDSSCSYESFPTLVPVSEGEASLLTRRLQIDQVQKTAMQKLQAALRDEDVRIIQLQEANRKLQNDGDLLRTACRQLKEENKKLRIDTGQLKEENNRLQTAVDQLMTDKKQLETLIHFCEKRDAALMTRLADIEEMLKKAYTVIPRKKTNLSDKFRPAGKSMSEAAFTKTAELKKNEDNEGSGDQKTELTVGTRVDFGKFPESLNGVRMPITWIVLEISSADVLLISEVVLDCRRFRLDNTSKDWEQSNLNKWLEETFFYKAFDKNERGFIVNTPDKGQLYLMNKYEVDYYFGTQERAVAASTAYAESSGGYSRQGKSRCSWWLRTGDYIDEFGRIHITTNEELQVNRGVRPVIKVKREALDNS